MPIAFNPTTGEAVLWDGKAWVPTKTATNSETGESVAWDGFSWEKINVPKPPSGLLPALSSGTDILQKGLYSALEGGAKSLGFEDLARFAGEGAARNEEEANLALPNPQSFGEAQSVGDYFTAAKEALGTSLPSMGPAAAGALAGAGIGSIVPGLGTAAGALIGGTLGGIPGFYGSNREAQKDVNEGVVKSEGAAILAAVPQAAMDTVLALAFPGLGKAVAGGLLTRVVKKGAEGIIEEVPTEFGQQVLERYQAGKPIADEEAINEYREVAIAAGVLGGGIGGVGGALQKRIQEPAPAPQTPADLAEHIANVRANMPGGGAAGSPAGGPAGGPPGLPSPPAPAGLLSQPPGPAGLLPPPSNFPGPFPGEAPPALGSPSPTPPIMPPSSGGAALPYQPQVDTSQFLPQPDLIEQLAQPEPPKQIPAEGANAPQVDANQQAAQLAAQRQEEEARRIAENAQQQAPSFDLPPQPQAAPEAAPEADQEPVDLASLSQQDYADYLAQSGLPQGVTAYNELTARPELRGLSGLEKNKFIADNMQKVRAYTDYINSWNLDNLKNIKYRPGEWEHFRINNDQNSSGGGRHKSYATFADPFSLTKEDFQSFLEKLRDNGYNGQVKIPSTASRFINSFDNLVMHGATEADALFARQTALEHFGDKISFTQMGRDSDTTSHTDMLSTKVEDALKAQKAQGGARPAPKPFQPKTPPNTAQQPAAQPQAVIDPASLPIAQNMVPQLKDLPPQGAREIELGARQIAANEGASEVTPYHFGRAANDWADRITEESRQRDAARQQPAKVSQASPNQNQFDKFAGSKTAEIVVQGLGQLNLAPGSKIDLARLLRQVNNIRQRMDVPKDNIDILKRHLIDLSRSSNPPVTVKGGSRSPQFFVPEEKATPEQRAAPEQKAAPQKAPASERNAEIESDIAKTLLDMGLDGSVSKGGAKFTNKINVPFLLKNYNERARHQLTPKEIRQSLAKMASEEDHPAVGEHGSGDGYAAKPGIRSFVRGETIPTDLPKEVAEVGELTRIHELTGKPVPFTGGFFVRMKDGTEVHLWHHGPNALDGSWDPWSLRLPTPTGDYASIPRVELGDGSLADVLPRIKGAIDAVLEAGSQDPTITLEYGKDFGPGANAPEAKAEAKAVPAQQAGERPTVVSIDRGKGKHAEPFGLSEGTVVNLSDGTSVMVTGHSHYSGGKKLPTSSWEMRFKLKDFDYNNTGLGTAGHSINSVIDRVIDVVQDAKRFGKPPSSWLGVKAETGKKIKLPKGVSQIETYQEQGKDKRYLVTMDDGTIVDIDKLAADGKWTGDLVQRQVDNGKKLYPPLMKLGDGDLEDVLPRLEAGVEAARLYSSTSIPDDYIVYGENFGPGMVLADKGPFTAENVVNNEGPEKGTPPQDTLIFMTCGQEKQEGGFFKAIELYTGSFFKTLRANLPKEGPRPKVIILSAEHGIISSNTRIEPYERRLDAGRIDELIGNNRRITESARRTARAFDNASDRDQSFSDIKNILLVGGADYQRVMKEIIARLKNEGTINADVGVMATSGGQGEQLGQLKGYIQTVTGQKAEPAEEDAAPKKKSGNRTGSLKEINQAIQEAGIPLELVRGEGYHYFVYDNMEVDGTASSLTIMVPYTKDFTIDRWVEEARGSMPEILKDARKGRPDLEEAAAPKYKAPVKYDEATVEIPTGGEIDVRYEIVELDSLKQAKGELQNRDRSRSSYEAVLADMYSKFNPKRLGKDDLTDRGAPVVGDDDIIDSGNGRALLLGKVYNGEDDAAIERQDAYKAFLEKSGYDLYGFEKPVLIRRRLTELTPTERRNLVIGSNKDVKAGLSTTERSGTDADALTPSVMELYRGGDINSAANREFVGAFLKSIPANERGNFTTKGLELSADGARRIRSAIKALAYDDVELLNTLDEAIDNDIRSIGTALEDVAGRWGQLRERIKAGDIRPDFDVTKQLVEAAKILRDIRRDPNANLKSYLEQQDMFSPKDPVVISFLKMFHAPDTKANGEYKPASQKSIIEGLNKYVNRASEQSTTPDLLGDVGTLTPDELINDINAERENKNDQGNMFASVLGDTNASALNASLPKKLTGAKPRYGFGKKNFPLAFDSDFSKALYIAYRKQNPYREWLIDQGVADGAIDIMGKLQRDNIKQIARDMPSGETLRVEDDFSIKPPEKAPKASPKAKKGANAPKADFEEEIAPTAGKRQEEAAAAAPQPVDPERLKQSRAIVKKFLQDMIDRGDKNAAMSALKAIKDKGLSDTEVHHYLLAMEITSRILGPTKIKPAYLFTNLALNHPQAGRAAAMAIPPGRSQKYLEGLMVFSLDPGSRKRIQMNAFHEAFHILQGLMQAHDPKTTQIINKAFKSGMTLDDVDPSIKRALQSAIDSDGVSYWDFFKSKYDTNPVLRSEFKKDYEASAYMFGLLAAAKQNGQNLNALMPAFKRFLNFIEQFRQRMGNALRGLGYRSVEDVFNDYIAGRQQRGYELKGNTIASGGPRASMLGPEPDEATLARRKVRAQELADAFKGKDVAQVAEWVANNTTSKYEPVARKVADRLKMLKRAGVISTVQIIEKGDKHPLRPGAVATTETAFGKYVDATNKIAPVTKIFFRGLSDNTYKYGQEPAPPLSDETVLHELLHAATLGSLFYGRKFASAQVAPNIYKATIEIVDIRNNVIDYYNKRVADFKAGKIELLDIEKKFDKWNTLQDADEFVSWGMTSPEFQQYLESIPVPKGTQTIFNQFVNAIRYLLGMEPGQNTTFSKLIQSTGDLLEADINEVRSLGHLFKRHLVNDTPTLEEITGGPMASVLMDDDSAHAPEIREGVATVMQGANTAARSAVSNWQKVKLVAKSVFDPLAKLPNTADYLVMRYRLVGRIDELEDEARGFHDTMKKATKEQSEAIFEYLTTRGAAVPNLPAELRDVAVTVKRRIKEIGIELSDPRVGILSPQSVAMYEDKYLPRLYMKYLLEEKGLVSTGPRMGLMEYARQRTDVDEETRVALGEVKDPGFASFAALYRPQRDIAVMKFLKGIAEASDKDWVYPDQLIEWKGTKVTAFWLADEANNIRERMLFEPDVTKKATMARVADDMQRLAADNVGEVPPQNYKRLPKSNRYGALKGLAVREEIYNDLISMGGFDPDPNLVDKIFGDKNSALAKGTQFWKMSKTILNPPTQIRQIISNAVMLNLSGVPLHKVASRMLQAMDAIKNDTEAWKKAKEYGIKGAGFSDNELREATNLLREYLADNSTGIMNPKKLMNIVAKITGKAGDFYQYTDQVFKVAKIIDEIERKGIARMPNGPAKERAYAEAALEGHRWFFDYSLVHRGIKSLRTMPFGAPFITYYYKALPLIVEVATNPRTALRFAPYIALMAAMPAMVASMYDVDDEDVDKLKMALSEKLREKPNMLIFPFKDQNGNWQFLDWGYFFPWSMFVDTGRALAKGDVVGALGTVGALTSPALSLASAIKTNVDPFTGRQIINEYDPPKEKMMAFLSYVNALIMPPIVTSYGAFGKAIEAATNSGVNRYGEPNMDAIQITARAMGFNFYPVVPELQRARNIRRMDYEIQMVKSNMTQSIKDKSLTPEKREAIRQDFIAELARRREARNKYIRDSAIPAELSSRANR